MENERQLHNAEPNPIEKRAGEVTWDDVAELKDQMNPEAAKRAVALEKIRSMEVSDSELINLTSKWPEVKINEKLLQNATKRNGNPNSVGRIALNFGNLPINNESVYRHVGSSAIVDLMNCGFVRNKREAADALDIPGKRGFGTEGAAVYWESGDINQKEKADLVIQASKSAASKGYVTKDSVQGIWVTDKNTGQAVNLIDGQNHAHLEIAPHR